MDKKKFFDLLEKSDVLKSVQDRVYKGLEELEELSRLKDEEITSYSIRQMDQLREDAFYFLVSAQVRIDNTINEIKQATANNDELDKIGEIMGFLENASKKVKEVPKYIEKVDSVLESIGEK